MTSESRGCRLKAAKATAALVVDKIIHRLQAERSGRALDHEWHMGAELGAYRGSPNMGGAELGVGAGAAAASGGGGGGGVGVGGAQLGTHMGSIGRRVGLWPFSRLWPFGGGGGGDVAQPRMLLCAKLHARDQALCAEMDALYTDDFFGSRQFRTMLRLEADARRGGLGLPNEIVSEVAVGVLRKLLAPLHGLIVGHVRQVSAATEESVVEAVSCYARPHNLHALLEPAAQIAISEGLERALAIGETLLAWENEPHTTSQAYLDIVQQSADAPASAKRFAQGINAKRSKELATEEHALVELQLKTYAYWHVMKRRLLDYVQLGTHAEVCPATVDLIALDCA